MDNSAACQPTVIRSAPISAIGVFVIEFLIGSSVLNDIVMSQLDESSGKCNRKSILIGQIAMVAASAITLPFYLDPGMVGIICNTLVLIIASALTQVTPEEKEARAALLVIPAGEKTPTVAKKTLQWSRATIFVGVLMAAILIILWVAPYFRGLAMA